MLIEVSEEKGHLGELCLTNVKLSVCLTKYHSVKTYGGAKL